MTSDTDNARRYVAEPGRFERFVELIKNWLKALEINSQLFVAIMNDQALPLEARALAAGVLVYIVVRRDIIPDNIRELKIITLIDDVIVMVIGLSIIVSLMPESRRRHYEQKYEVVAKISYYEDILKAALGLLWDRLVQYVANLRYRSYKNTTAEEAAESPDMREDLFDQTMMFVANLNLDPETIDKELRALPAPEEVIRLLASGIEEDEKRQDDDSIASRSWNAIRRALPAGENDSE